MKKLLCPTEEIVLFYNSTQPSAKVTEYHINHLSHLVS